MKKRWNISNSQIANCIQDYILAITKVFNGLHIFAQQVAGWLSGRSANQCRGCICEVHHDRWRLAICCRSCRGHATARPNAESGAAGGSSASRSGTVSTMLQGTVQRENVSHSHDQGAKVEPPESISQDIKARCNMVLKHLLKLHAGDVTTLKQLLPRSWKQLWTAMHKVSPQFVCLRWRSQQQLVEQVCLPWC